MESVGFTVTDDFFAVIGDEKVRFGAFETRERVPHDPEQWKKENPKSYYYIASTRKYDYRRNGEINLAGDIYRLKGDIDYIDPEELSGTSILLRNWDRSRDNNR